MADLTKAMQAAAEDARALALSQLQTEAKTHVELIHGRSSTEAAGLRRAADDDVAAVREWSKAEIARVREETETKITKRKARLESEIEEHAGVIEREIDAVQKTVAAYEDEMAAFFERLLAEEDPSRFATMAENLPEAPSFDDIVAGPAPVVAEARPSRPSPRPSRRSSRPARPRAGGPRAWPSLDAERQPPRPASSRPTPADESISADAVTDESEAVAGSIEGGEGFPGFEGGTGDGGDGEGDREAAFAAIQAAAEAAASAEVAADAAARAEAVADVAIEIIGNHEEEGESDPRFAALGLSPDYDAAEAEALAAAEHVRRGVPEIGDDALAARLAGLVRQEQGRRAGRRGDADRRRQSRQRREHRELQAPSRPRSRRPVGRRLLGPDGEFVFAVNHSADVILRDAIPSLPSFQARVTGSSDGVVHVTAHDPESDA